MSKENLLRIAREAVQDYILAIVQGDLAGLQNAYDRLTGLQTLFALSRQRAVVSAETRRS